VTFHCVLSPGSACRLISVPNTYDDCFGLIPQQTNTVLGKQPIETAAIIAEIEVAYERHAHFEKVWKITYLYFWYGVGRYKITT
jgi:hypothetical protein